MSWNFRVMRHAKVDLEPGSASEWLAIHEVHYESANVNDIEVTSADVGYTDKPVIMTAESVEDFRFMLTKMLEALEKPILEYKES